MMAMMIVVVDTLVEMMREINRFRERERERPGSEEATCIGTEVARRCRRRRRRLLLLVRVDIVEYCVSRTVLGTSAAAAAAVMASLDTLRAWRR